MLILRIVAPAMMAFIPLTSDLDYEFAETLNIINVIFFAVWMSTERAHSNTSYHSGVLRTVNRLLLPIIFFDFVIISIAMIAGHHLHWYRTFGLYFLLPFVGSWIGLTLGYVCRFFIQRRPWLGVAIILLFTLILNLIWLLFTAPIFVYSIWWGYFAGPIYDEWIPLTDTLVFHRLFSLGFAFAIFISGDLITRKLNNTITYKKFISLMAAVWLVITGLFYWRDNWGWDTSYATLEQKLNVVYDDERLTIYSDTTSKFVTRYVSARIKQVTDWLNINPAKVKIFIYPDAQTKKILMGAGGTNFAKVWRNEVHVNSDDAEFTIKHEAVHVLASSFGHPLYSTTKPGMLEGLAVAAAWDESQLTPHEWSAALYKLNKLPDITALMEPMGFWSSSSGLAYTVSGSFVRFLVDQYPIQNIHRVYASEDFKDVYELPLDTLQERWKFFLNTIELDSLDLRIATTLLQPSIFRRRCPHYVADLQKEYYTSIEMKEWDNALKLTEQIISTGTSPERWVLSRARIHFKQKKYDAALSKVEEVLNKSTLSYTMRGWALLLKADIVFCQGQNQKSMDLTHEIMTLYDQTTSVYEAALWSDHLMRHPDNGTLYASWLDAVDQNKAGEWYSVHYDKKDDAIFSYKLISYLYQTSQYDSIFSYIKTHPMAITDSSVYLKYNQLLGDAAQRIELWSEAEQYYRAAQQYAKRTTEKVQLNDRLELIHYLKNKIE